MPKYPQEIKNQQAAQHSREKRRPPARTPDVTMDKPNPPCHCHAELKGSRHTLEPWFPVAPVIQLSGGLTRGIVPVASHREGYGLWKQITYIYLHDDPGTRRFRKQLRGTFEDRGYPFCVCCFNLQYTKGFTRPSRPRQPTAQPGLSCGQGSIHLLPQSWVYISSPILPTAHISLHANPHVSTTMESY